MVLLSCQHHHRWHGFCHGLDQQDWIHTETFCKQVAEAHEPVVISDVRDHPRLADHSLVTREPGVRFFAGVPLASSSGALLLFDTEPHTAESFDQALLNDVVALAQDAIDHLELRRTLKARKRRHRSERKTTQAQLKDFYENALDQLPLEIAIMDVEGRYLYLNPAAVGDDEMRQWMIGKTAIDYSHKRGLDPEPFEQRVAWVRQVAASREMSQHEETFIDRSGEMKHILRVAMPVLDAEGQVSQVFAYGIDLTDRKRFEEELKEAKDQAEEMVRLKDAFLANMSHEIRTPLTGILGFTQVLADEVPDDIREPVRLIQRSGERLMATLNSVLDLAQLEARNVTLNARDVNVHAEIEEAVRLLSPRAAARHLTLDVRGPSDVHATLDRTHLRRILDNLIGNAIKFTDEGGVLITLEANEQEVILRIEDTGIGISEAFLPHLFDAFKQESEGLARDYEGSGLGLTITKHLVELMGGTLSVESEKGVGSTFTVVLPRTGCTAAPHPHAMSQDRSASMMRSRARRISSS